MATKLRVLAVATAVLSAPLLTALPASAGGPGVVLDKEYCESFNSSTHTGVFTRVKGVKTCTSTGVETFVEDLWRYSDDGVWFATYNQEVSLGYTSVMTQRGRGALNIDRDSWLVSAYVIAESRTCAEIVNGAEEARPVEDCEILGLYEIES